MVAWDTAGNNVGTAAFLGTTSPQPLRIRTSSTVNNTDVLTITPAPDATTTGNVGIGTPTPGSKLEVQGGIHGQGDAPSGRGLPGGVGVWGDSRDNTGVHGSCGGRFAAGVVGEGAVTGMSAFASRDPNPSASTGVIATGYSYGVFAQVGSLDGTAVTGFGGTRGSGVFGNSSNVGVEGVGVSGGTGVRGSSARGSGVRGLSSAGNNAGVFGTNDAPDIPNDGFGVVGVSNAGFGAAGFSTSRTGVYGQTAGDGRAAVYGDHIGTTTPAGSGVTGRSVAGYGVAGVSLAPGLGGVWAQGPDLGVVGFTGTPEAPNPDGYSGYFASKVFVNGKLEKNGGGFIIDHPLEPANKYLNHSFVESAEMKNIYDGVVELDEEGTAWVELSEYFEALNRDYRYQLTAIGRAAPELHVAEELSDNRFKVAGGKEGMKICWQVTGVRKDRWAEANPIEVEQEKPEENRGRYLHPGLYGVPEERSVARPFLTDVAAQEEEQQPPELPSDDLTRLQEERQQQIEEQRRWIEELRRRMEGQKEPQEEGSS